MVEERKHKRPSKDTTKKGRSQAEWTATRKEEQRQRVDSVKHMIQTLGERKRSGDGKKLRVMQNAVEAVVKIIDDVEKIDQTLGQVAKKVDELERDEDAKQVERQRQEQEREREAGREPRKKSILKCEAHGQSCSALAKRTEVFEDVPKEQVETVVIIVVEAVQKVVGEVMNNVIEKMVTDEKMMIQDDYVVADVVEKLGQMMKGDGDKVMEGQMMRDGLLEMEEREEDAVEATSLERSGITSLEGPKVTGIKGAKMTGFKGTKMTGFKGAKATDLEWPKETDLEWPNVTDLAWPKVTDLEWPNVTDLAWPKVTDLEWPKATDLEEPEVTWQWTSEVTGPEIPRQELSEEDLKETVDEIVQGLVEEVSKEREEADSVEESDLELVEETAFEALEEAALGPMEQAALELAEEAVSEPVEEAATEPVEEAMKKPVVEDVEEPVEQAMQERVKQAAKGPVKQAAKAPVKQAAKKPVQQAAKELAEGDIKLTEVEQPLLQAARNEIEALRQVYGILIDMTAGLFDVTAFKDMLGALKFKVDTVDILQTFQYMDGDNDGKVSFEDFLKVMTDDNNFARFIANLPDSCTDSKVQKGYVDNRVFFKVLSTLLQSQMLSEDTTATIVDYYYRKKKGAKLRSKANGSEPIAKTFMGVSVYSLIQYLDVLEPEEVYKEKRPTPEQTLAFAEVFQYFDKNSKGHVETAGLLNTMRRLAIELDNPFIPDAAKFATVNSGKEVSFQEFVRIMADTGTFGQFLRPQEPACGSHMLPEALPFEILLENMHSSTIHPETRKIIVNYYQTKYERLRPQILDLSRKRASGKGAKSRYEAAGDRKVKQAEAKPAGTHKAEQQEAKLAKPKTLARLRPSRPTGDAKSPNPGGEHRAPSRKGPSSDGPRPKQASASSHMLQRPGRPQHPKGPAPDHQKKTVLAKGIQVVPTDITDSIHTYRQQCINLNPSPAAKPKQKKGKGGPLVDNHTFGHSHANQINPAAK
ncbi:hypothetical protein scyTo_0021098 [Scyliorhinus torazame]|uniref:EF-hand domain-containing protein n=1 Tax=Scyliorhinus torazame TaxID=75743 RepID=A0A401PW32_SCYTO|nr:hypothetical protein [Scyliorhinus torazame]